MCDFVSIFLATTNGSFPICLVKNQKLKEKKNDAFDFIN